MTPIYKSEAGERAVRERYLTFLAHWPVANRQFHVSTREGETFVVACGPENAPALVLLHGSSFNSVSWMGDVTAWARNFRVYAVDVIGHPNLSAPSRPRYDSEAYALWLDDVLGALRVERASFAGISLGGWLALDYAIRRPERVASLVLLCPGGGRARDDQPAETAVRDLAVVVARFVGTAQASDEDARRVGRKPEPSLDGRRRVHVAHLQAFPAESCASSEIQRRGSRECAISRVADRRRA
jgi:pimeloyl-ACP methyl ester carboxylesterase